MKTTRHFVAAVVMGVLAIFTPFQVAVADGTAFSEEHVAKIRPVSSARVSADGKHIAYTISVQRKPFEDENGRAWVELHVVDRDGRSRPFVTGEVNVSDVRWRPHANSISFLAERGKDEHKSLYVIPVDGGEARNILSHKTDISSYSWSPDGSRVAFIAKEKKPKDRDELEDKGFNAEIYEEDFLAREVWIAQPDDPDAKPRKLDLPGYPSEMHWSPVDDRLALALAPTPLIDDHYMHRKVHIVDAESGGVFVKIDNPGKLGDIAWSPDGKHIAFISGEDIHDPADGRLMVASATSGEFTDILPGYIGLVSSIAWQDADTIMYLGQEGVYTRLAELKRDGTAKKTHVEPADIVLSELSLSKDGQSAAMRSTSPKYPYEVFAMSHGESAPRRLTWTNPWLDKMRFAKQEVVRFTARDGERIEGILIRPLDEEPGLRYPLILSVHGGPEAHDRNGWLTGYGDPGQVAAARGFAVFYPNYRGSTGRGVAFSKAHQADYGGKEFNDLVDAVDHLIEIGLVDQDRVGITGGSYGGFATAWCSTYHSERFAAGVMFVGISDQISKGGTTDIPEEMFLVHSRTRLWDGWQFFLERSPIYYVEKARTPLLILHGKEDTRVHPSQSMEMYRNLKILGQTPVRLVLYPGEGHGNRKAAGRYDYNLRMMRWFEHYLKGEGGAPPPHELEYPLQKEAEEDDEDGGAEEEDSNEE